MNFSQSLTLFTEEGREHIHRKLRPNIQLEISKLLQSSARNRSVEYMDNRISRYSMKMGQCEITGIYLFASDVHCHHYLPINLGGTDIFDNLRILDKDVHKLIHASQKETIDILMAQIGITENMLVSINQYREKSGQKGIKQSHVHE